MQSDPSDNRPEDLAENSAPQEGRKGVVRGRYAVFATLSLFIIVPAIAIAIAPLLTGNSKTLDLDYDKRHGWFTMPVKPRPLEYSKFVAAETGKQYKKTDLTIAPDTEQVLRRCVGLAQREDFFDAADTREALEPLAEEASNGFYPAYLLASWHRVNGDTTAFDKWIRIAFDRAEGALAQRLLDEKGQPVADHRLPPAAIGYDRVTEGKLNATLVLIYPAPTSDETGVVYLPTYRSVYRLTDPDLPLGADPGLHPRSLTLLPQPSDGQTPNWFAVPDGAVGQLPDAVIDTP